jgi:hypothetical protein
LRMTLDAEIADFLPVTPSFSQDATKLLAII